MATNFYLIRHGQTVYNTEDRMQGRYDSPLTELGIQQAANAGKELSNTEIVACYTSPAGRAQTTAEIILENRDVPIIIDDRLAEISLGEWEGDNYITSNPNFIIERDNFWNHPEYYDHRPHKGESFQAIEKRMLDALEEIALKHKDERILITSHTLSIRSVLNYFIKRDIKDFWGNRHLPSGEKSVVIWESRDKGDVMFFAGEKI